MPHRVWAIVLRDARHRSGLTQREVARRAGVPPSTVARVETGRIIPRADTLQRLLEATGNALAALPTPGAGVDRSQIRELLAMDPAERFQHAVVATRNLDTVRRRARDQLRRS